MLNKTSSYQLKLNKAVCGGVRNFDCYYVVVKQQGNATKYISKAMRNDEDNQDLLNGDIEIRPSHVQLWNYDKLKLVEAYPVDFKQQQIFRWTNYQQNMELVIVQVQPQTKVISKSSLPLSNGEQGEIEKSKAGSQRSIDISAASRDKSKVQEAKAANELMISGALPPLPKRQE